MNDFAFFEKYFCLKKLKRKKADNDLNISIG